MELFDKLFKYHFDALTRQFPRAEPHIIEKAAYQRAKAEVDSYDHQADFERTWKHVVRTAS